MALFTPWRKLFQGRLSCESRIIGVASGTRAKEGGGVRRIECRLLLQPRNQIGIGQSQFAHWHQVSQTGFDILIKIFRRCIGAIDKKRAFPDLAQVFNQDTFNLPKVQAGLKTLAMSKGTVTLAVYQETKIRHFHKILDEYLKR